ncbi:hypothetical protein SAMN04515671_2068 [Nakamurella panacisegetis]|uniref:Uncharacterized protein n=1 Tax=Nakamurella panacisegetis TaxID=1090615 RepID=A0A1H0MP91_9ACTN|nr:hypothetical protein [Nakamurella panacisegetis]SDO82273.1 hypothetical protein SAMN04515671_2068 [Nakamurella panacisegetis]
MTDDEMDAILKDWGAQLRAVPISGPDQRLVEAVTGRGRSRWRAVGATVAVAALVAAVAAVAIAVPILRAGRNGADNPPATGGAPHTATPSTSRIVTFGNLSLDVPKAWKLNDQKCGQPLSNTVLIPASGAPACGIPTRPVTALWLYRDDLLPPSLLAKPDTGLPANVLSDMAAPERPLSSATTVGQVAGIPAKITSGAPTDALHRTLYVLPSIHVAVLISSPDASLIGSLIASARLVDQDQNGCVATLSDPSAVVGGKSPARGGADQQLVPGAPESAVACRYLKGTLAQSASVSAESLTTLIAAMNDAPSGLSVHRPPDGSDCRVAEETVTVQLEYASGPPLSVRVHLNGCGGVYGASNGTLTRQLAEPMVTLLHRTVGFYDVGSAAIAQQSR